VTSDSASVGIIGLCARGFYTIGMTVANSCRATGFRIVALCDRNGARMVEVRDALAPLFAARDGLEATGMAAAALKSMHGGRVPVNMHEVPDAVV